jgi:hypothetical protein
MLQKETNKPKILSFLRELSVIGSVIAFCITSIFMWYSFNENLDTIRGIATVNLARDLSKEYSSNSTFNKIYKSIINCEVLYTKNGGTYDYDAINEYLGFLDAVAFFYHSGALDYDTVNHHFGGYIIEAFVYKEIHDYMISLRQNAGEEGALEDFEKLSEEIKLDPKRRRQVELFTRDCTRAKRQEFDE